MFNFVRILIIAVLLLSAVNSFAEGDVGEASTGDPMEPETISEADFHDALRRYRGGRRLRRFGVFSLSSAGVFFTYGLAIQVFYPTILDWDGDSGLDRYDRRVRNGMFLAASATLVSGLIMFKVGQDKLAAERPLLERYREQQRGSPEFSIAPVFDRGGGGARLMVTF